MSDISDLVQIARSQIGTEEDPQHQNVGSSIKKYQDSTSLGGQGWPWCAAFVDWCVQQFAPEDAKIAHIPRTAAALVLLTGRIIIISTCLTRQVAQAGERHKAVISLSTSSRIAESFPIPAMTTTISTRSRETQIPVADGTAMKWLNAAATLVR